MDIERACGKTLDSVTVNLPSCAEVKNPPFTLVTFFFSAKVAYPLFFRHRNEGGIHIFAIQKPFSLWPKSRTASFFWENLIKVRVLNFGTRHGT